MENRLKELLEKEDKEIFCEETFVVKHVELINDLDLIKLNLQQNNSVYKGLVMIKGNTFPIPKINQILSVKKIFLKINGEFQLQLFIDGKIDEQKKHDKDGKANKENNRYKNNIEEEHCFSFDYENIFKTISKLTNIPLPENRVMIFRILNISEKGLANIKSISDSNIYILELKEHQVINYTNNDFIMILCYELEKNKIKTNKMTTFEILNEGRLLSFLDSISIGNVNLFQVVDKVKDNIILVDKNQIMFKLNKNEEIIKNMEFYFCTTIIISNYDTILDSIKINNNSFIYEFRKESYYIEKILTNLVTVLEFHFLDYKKEYNRFDRIKNPIYFEEDKTISKDIEYIIFLSPNSKNYEYYPLELTLFNSKDKEIISISFTIYIYPGVINKINAFINVDLKEAFFFEYLYYNITDNLGEVEKIIDVNGKCYDVNIYDSFGSQNRKRICIMNIPYQKMEIEENELKSNSIQVCELIKNGFHKIVGIYDITNEIKDKEKENICFNEYYEQFGDLYNMLKNYSLSSHESISRTLENKFNEYSKNKFESITDTTIYAKSLTLSQFKTWFGLIICEFVKIHKNDYSNIDAIIKQIIQIFIDIRNEKLEYIDMIRILIFTLDRNLGKDGDSKFELKFISRLKKNSPYLLAFEFNKNQIKSLNEFSALFQAYLQIDSYKAFNYIHSEQSHTFSLELTFMIKTQLLSTYEDFFFVTRENKKRYAFIDCKTKITAINELITLGEDYDESNVINDLDKARNYAMPISIDFLHEKDGHHKYSLKNKNDLVPCLYYRGLKTEIEVAAIFKELNILKGESGVIIENFICKDKYIINALSKKHIFGEFLKPEYFEGKDFNKLIGAVKEKLKSNAEQEEKKINSPNDKNSKQKEEKFTFNSVGNDKELYLFSNCIMDDVDYIKENLMKEIMMTEEEKKEIEKKNNKKRIEKLENLKKKRLNKK